MSDYYACKKAQEWAKELSKNESVQDVATGIAPTLASAATRAVTGSQEAGYAASMATTTTSANARQAVTEFVVGVTTVATGGLAAPFWTALSSRKK